MFVENWRSWWGYLRERSRAALFDADDGDPNACIVQFAKLLICPVDRNRRVYRTG